MKTKDNPGVYIPPPLLYVLLFFLSIYLQKMAPLSFRFIDAKLSPILGLIFILLGVIIVLPALVKFFNTKNTLVTIKPANSLQTSGIYSISRNPMYLALLSIYTGIAFFKGNDWTFIFIPLVIFTITYLVIIKEENYLKRAFGNEYLVYMKSVRRWI